MKNKKIHKRVLNNDKKIIIYSVVSLFVLFILILAISLAFFTSSNKASGTITVGEIDFSIYENNTNVSNIVPGDNINKTITIINSRNVQGTNTNNLGSLLFKYRIEVYVDDEIDDNLSQLIMPIVSNNLFTESNGEYFYNDVLNVSEYVDLCQSLNFSVQIDDTYQDESIYITFLIDAIQAENGAYLELWQDAPQDWVDIIGNIV